MVDNKLSSRDAVLEAGFAVFSRDPGASLAEVAAQAGVGRATLHRHFAGRDDLMVALARTAMAELDAAVEAATRNAPSYTDALRLIMEAVVPLAHRQKFLAQERVAEEALEEDYAASDRELMEAISAAQAEGAFEAHLPVEWIAGFYNNLIYAGWELVEAGEATPKQAAAFAWRVLTKGASA